MKSVKQRLIEAIEKDIQANFFMPTTENELNQLINYLKTNKLPNEWEKNDYIVMARQDFITLCNEFDVS
jgi:hypothetical protein